MTSNEDLLIEIFTWMSALVLMNIGIVSKAVKDTIHSRYFRKRQCTNMERTNFTEFFVQLNLPDGIFQEKPEVYSFEGYNFHFEQVLDNIVKFVGDNFQIYTSFNGLLCCKAIDEGYLRIINPTTCNIRDVYIPMANDYGVQRRFGVILDEDDIFNENEFLMLMIIDKSDWAFTCQCNVLVTTTNIWRTLGDIPHGSRYMQLASSIKARNVVYLLSENGSHFQKGNPFFWPYLVAYNMLTDMSSFLMLPKTSRKGMFFSELGVFKWINKNTGIETICFVKYWRKKFSIWILHDRVLARKNMWEKIFHKRIKAMGVQNSEKESVTSFFVTRDNMLVFATTAGLYKFDLSRQEDIEAHCPRS